MKDDYIGFLVCNNCNGYYELQSGEFPDDFSECDCGGSLEFQEINPELMKEDRNDFWRGIIVGIISMFIVFFIFKLLIASIIGGAITSYIIGGNYKKGARNGFITGIIFMVLLVSSALIIGMFYGKLNLGLNDPSITLYARIIGPIILIGMIFLEGVTAALGGIIGIKIRKIRINLQIK